MLAVFAIAGPVLDVNVLAHAHVAHHLAPGFSRALARAVLKDRIQCEPDKLKTSALRWTEIAQPKRGCPGNFCLLFQKYANIFGFFEVVHIIRRRPKINQKIYRNSPPSPRGTDGARQAVLYTQKTSSAIPHNPCGHILGPTRAYGARLTS